jgi:hypothetical protein
MLRTRAAWLAAGLLAPPAFRLLAGTLLAGSRS